MNNVVDKRARERKRASKTGKNENTELRARRMKNTIHMAVNSSGTKGNKCANTTHIHHIHHDEC